MSPDKVKQIMWQKGNDLEYFLEIIFFNTGVFLKSRIENEVEIEGLVANVLGELFYPQQSQRLEKSASRSSALMFRDTLHFRLCCPFP